MGAVYCAFSVNFFNFYQANLYVDMLSYMLKCIMKRCSAIYIVTEPNAI